MKTAEVRARWNARTEEERKRIRALAPGQTYEDRLRIRRQMYARGMIPTATTRRAVLERDGYTCQDCGKKLGLVKGDTRVHHTEYNGDRKDITVLVTLCHVCHVIRHKHAHIGDLSLEKKLARKEPHNGTT